MKSVALVLTMLLSMSMAAPADTTYAALAAREESGLLDGLKHGALGGGRSVRRDGAQQAAQSEQAMKAIMQAMQGKQADFNIANFVDFLRAQQNKGIDKRDLTERDGGFLGDSFSALTRGVDGSANKRENAGDSKDSTIAKEVEMLEQALMSMSAEQTKQMHESMKGLQLKKAKQLSTALQSMTSSQSRQLKQAMGSVAAGSLGNVLAGIVEHIPIVGSTLANFLASLPVKERDLTERDMADMAMQSGSIGDLLADICYKLANSLRNINIKREELDMAMQTRDNQTLGQILAEVLNDLGDFFKSLPVKKRDTAMGTEKSAQLSKALQSMTASQAAQVNQAVKALQATGPLGRALVNLLGNLPLVGDILRAAAQIVPVKARDMADQAMTAEKTQRLNKAMMSMTTKQSEELHKSLEALKATGALGNQLGSMMMHLPVVGSMLRGSNIQKGAVLGMKRAEAAAAGAGGDLISSLVDLVKKILQALINLLNGLTGETDGGSSSGSVPDISSIISSLSGGSGSSPDISSLLSSLGGGSGSSPDISSLISSLQGGASK